MKRLGYNLKLSSGELNDSLNGLLKNAFGKNEQNLIDTLMIRSMSKAEYTTKNIGHYGLSFENYTHFTSPIRRYSDLNVHRDLLDFFFEGKKNSIQSSLHDHLILQEKKSDSIERKILERACSLFIKNIKKKYFIGIVDGVESFGIFIRAVDLPFSCLVRNNKNFKNLKFSNQDNKFRIGQMVSFKIKRNDVKSGRILGERVKIIK